jgi:diacylglycerol kinase family enzyme
MHLLIDSISESVMHVSVIINSKAGSVDEGLIRKKIAQSLFRCDLVFFEPHSIHEMSEFIFNEIKLNTDALVVCGGDGTINAVLQTLMPMVEKKIAVPALCIVSSGTANDLAFELGVDQKIPQAVRALLEGVPKKIDVIEIECQGEKKYMITCGGVGVPARTAGLANEVRGSLRQLGENKNASKLVHFASITAYRALKQLGASLYSLLLFYAFAKWDHKTWEVEVTPISHKSFKTKSGFVFVNNQASLGAHFFPAPYTANDDGLVNILVAPVHGWFSLLKALVEIQKGNTSWDRRARSFEVTQAQIRDAHGLGRLSFFGDGEILFSGVNEIKITCLHRALPFLLKA